MDTATEKAAGKGQASESVLLRDDNREVATLTLNRPAQYNALSGELIAALQRELDDIAADRSIRAVVIAARGKAFCPGHDLREMADHRDEEYYRELFAASSRVMLTITRQPQPVIARVQGVATAAGCQLVSTCDLAVASTEARFGTSGINAGLFCATPSVALTRNISRKRAAEMLFTGEFINAETALDFGILNRVVPPEGLDDAVATLTDSIRAKSRVAIETGKALVWRQLQMGLTDAYDLAARAMAENAMSEDTQEGIRAFAEKRPPVWKHR